MDIIKSFINGDVASLTAQIAPFVTSTYKYASNFYLSKVNIFKIVGYSISLVLLIVVIHSINAGAREMKKLRGVKIGSLLGDGEIARPRYLKAWQIVQSRLVKKEEGQIKLAVIEADRLLDHVLIAAGYGGTSFDERLEKLTPTQVSNLKDLEGAHELAERLLNEPGAEITFEGAERTIKIYQKTFEDFGLIDPSE